MTLGGAAGDAPARVGFPVVDTLTGQTAAFAILAALLRRAARASRRIHRRRHVRCQHGFHDLSHRALSRHRQSARAHRQYRLQRTLPPSAVFNASDGRQISLGVVQQPQFEALAREVGCKHWLEDPRFLTPDLRRKHSAEMQAELDQVFGEAPVPIGRPG